jgi:hypothetical protein
MCAICRGELKGDEKEINVSHCDILKEIPRMNNLLILYCNNCYELTKIPIMNNLIELHCYNCPLLTNIPKINTLTVIDCANCLSLTDIPILPNLLKLYCEYCPLLLSIPHTRYSCKYNCKWLNITNEQLNRLTLSQKIVKRYLNRKKFIIRLELVKHLPLVIIDLIKK